MEYTKGNKIMVEEQEKCCYQARIIGHMELCFGGIFWMSVTPLYHPIDELEQIRSLSSLPSLADSQTSK